jgi:hypothetical protein
MAEKKASKEHKARDHSAIAQSHFSLPQFERVSLWERATRLNGGFPTNVVNAHQDRSPKAYCPSVFFLLISTPTHGAHFVPEAETEIATNGVLP